jgi:hypothetical protein
MPRTQNAYAGFRLPTEEYEALRARAKARGVVPSALLRGLLKHELDNTPPESQHAKSLPGSSTAERISEPFVRRFHGEADDRPFQDAGLEELRQRALKAGVRPEGFFAALVSGKLDQPTPTAAEALAAAIAEQMPGYGQAEKADSKWGPLIDKVLADMAAERVAKKAAKPKAPAGDEPFTSPRLERIRLQAALEKPPIPASGLLAALASGGFSPNDEITARAPLTADEISELVDRWLEVKT